MPAGLMARLWTGLLATSPLEALAVLLSLIYVVLAVPRSRWCWVAGGLGSLIYVWVFARARLPMQSLLLAVAIAHFLAAETQAAWPQLDASTAVLSLFASWLTARGKLENWLYWIVVDAVQVWLYAAQGLVFTAFLFLIYLVIAAAGFVEWLKIYRSQAAR